MQVPLHKLHKWEESGELPNERVQPHGTTSWCCATAYELCGSAVAAATASAPAKDDSLGPSITLIPTREN